MPTSVDKNGVVHDVDVSTGSLYRRCDLAAAALPFYIRAIARQDLLQTHEAGDVTCLECLALDPFKPARPQFIVCDQCGQWYIEVDGKLVEASPADADQHDSFSVLNRGTLPSCKQCL